VHLKFELVIKPGFNEKKKLSRDFKKSIEVEQIFSLGTLLNIHKKVQISKGCKSPNTLSGCKKWKICNILVVYPLLGKTSWSTVVVNGTRQKPIGNFPRDALVPITRLFPERW